MQKELGIGDEQHHKTPEKDEVIDAEGAADYAPLSEGIVQHIPDALADIVKTVISLAQQHQAEASETAPGKKCNRNHKDSGEYGNTI